MLAHDDVPPVNADERPRDPNKAPVRPETLKRQISTIADLDGSSQPANPQ
jgi:hypothetical protein